MSDARKPVQGQLPLQPPAKPVGAKPAKAVAAKPAAGKPAKAAPRKTARPAPKRPSAPARMRPITLITFALTLFFDQLTKWIVIYQLDLPQKREIDLISPWLNLRMAWNQGMNFGLMSSSADATRWLLVAIALIVCGWVGYWVWRSKPGPFGRIAAGLLIGGAIGNVIDRLNYGAVADFLNMSLPNWTNPYSFNIADIAIFAGALGLVFMPQGPKDAPQQKSAITKTDAKPRDGGRKSR